MARKKKARRILTDAEIDERYQEHLKRIKEVKKWPR